MNAPVNISDDALRWVELLRGSADAPLHWRLLHDKDKENNPAIMLFGPLAQHYAEITEKNAAGYGVFAVVNAGGNHDRYITEIAANYIDLDDKPEPSAWHLLPHFSVYRDATHAHHYWLSSLAVADFTTVQLRLIARYNSDDCIHNRSRVMRVPGFYHHKGEPILVSLVDHTLDDPLGPAAYTAEEIVAGLPAVRQTKHEARKAAAGIALDTEANKEAARRHVKLLAERGDVAVAGQRGNIRTYNLFAEIMDRFALGPVAAVEATEEWNDKCRPRWSDDELAGIANNAAKYMQNDVGASAVAPGSETFGPIAEKVAADVEAQPAAAFVASAEQQDAQSEKPRFKGMLYDEYSALAPPELLCKEINLPKFGVHFVNAEKEHFKTFLVGGKIGLAVARGKDFSLGSGLTLTINNGCQGIVIDFLAEAPNGVATKRNPALFEAAGVPKEERNEVPLVLIPDVPRVALGMDSEAREAIAEIHRWAKHWPKMRVALVIFDTLSKMLGGMDMSASPDMTKAIAIAEAVQREFQCCVVILHHPNADEPDRGHGSRTSGRDVNSDAFVDRPGKSGDLNRPLCCKWRNGKDKDEGIGGEEIYFEMTAFAGSLVPELIAAARYHKLARGGALSGEQQMLAALVGLGCYPEGAHAVRAGDPTTGCGDRALARAMQRLDGYAALPEGQKATAEQESALADSIERWRGKIASLTKATRKKKAPLDDCRVQIRDDRKDGYVARHAIVKTRWDALGPLERAKLLQAAQPLFDAPGDDSGEFEL